ncbi:MAG TPA: zf-HC2 domain-containing protein [Gemmatimonadaceae bacterium]
MTDETGETGEITCEVAARRLWDYIDGRLSPMSHSEVDQHLAVCSGCPQFVTFAQLMRESLAGCADRQLRLDSGEHEALRRRLHAMLAAARAV